MAKKLKWFAAGYLTHSIFSGNKKEGFTPEEKERKLQEYNSFFNSHPRLTTLIFLLVAGVLVWVL